MKDYISGHEYIYLIYKLDLFLRYNDILFMPLTMSIGLGFKAAWLIDKINLLQLLEII